ncbi:MAG: ABC transporter permease [Acidimicrobiaceae bacterium]|jgi:peptide/nickel transport system permease protein|nr:ABC transporter permease [Acidimicrobiaceae bacterium]NDH96357.1 ABC transporter permease [Actinomycetota bacterium]
MKQIAARIAWSVGLILAVIVMCFSLVHLAPGDAALVIAGDSGAGDPELIEEIREDLGLDDPYLIQLSRYVGDVASGDLGTSYRFNESVTSLIGDRIWPTILLVTTALLFAIVIGVLVGIFTARRPESPVSHGVTVFSLVGYSMPVFWTGYLLIIAFASNVRWFPIAGMRDVRFEGNRFEEWLDIAHHLVLPALTLGLIYLAQYSRLSRASMLEVLQSDYVRTARAKGLAERKVVYKHALRNAVIPVITIAGLQFGALLSGALLVETVFNWPGLGRLAADSVFQRDAPVLLGVLICSAALVVVINILTDVVYRMIDPRIRVGGGS